jgi:hypothetical protein
MKGSPLGDQPSAVPWTPPRWLRDLHLVAAEARACSVPAPEDGLRAVFVLMSFAAARLHEQAERRGCTVGELLNTYDRAIDRLRARA